MGFFFSTSVIIATAEYFREHPEKIDERMAIIFEDDCKDSDLQALLSSLRAVRRA